MKLNRSKFLLITILTVLLLGLTSWPAGLNARRENNSSIEENSKSVVNHAPISIEGNDALATFIVTEELSGSGTFASPYIIENFIIEASTAHGVEIQSTDAYLIIRNCTIGGGFSSYDGIHLINAANINVSNNNVKNNDYGIYLHSSSNNTISGNNASYNSDSGISLSYSWKNTLSWNNASYNNRRGVLLNFSNQNTLIGNTVNNNDWDGILLYSSSNNTLFGNIGNNNDWDGILLYSSSNNNILSRNNASYNNRYGIYLVTSSSTNTIYLNDIYGNTNSQAYEGADCTDNEWDNGITGNYWGKDYISNYPSATNDGIIWNIPYEISGDGSGIDHFPLVNSITTYDTTEDTTPTTTPSGNVLLLLLSLFIMLQLRRSKKKT